MKGLTLVSITLVVFILFSAGCTSQTDSISEKNVSFIQDKDAQPGQTEIDAEHEQPVVQSEKTSPSHSTGEEDRYYYNIRIIDPSDLESLSKELSSDEYPITNEKGDLIGIVSPRKLYIRGDLVDLQKVAEKTGKMFDKTDVAEHLVDITFGNDNPKIDLFRSDKDYQFWLDAYYSTDDTRFLLDLAPVLNTLSETTQFEDEELALGFLKTNYADVPYYFYNIKIIPENMLEDFKDDRKSDERLIKDSEGNFIGMVAKDHLYLLDSLTPEDRQYYMLYGILYSMGMHGTTYSERDSFFYHVGDVRNTELSDLDKEAIKLLYGGRVKNGADMEETRKTLGLKT